MKRTFTSLLLLAFALGGSVYAQCTPDPSVTGSGIFPTPVDGVAPGTVGNAYSQVLTINVPQDTTFDLSVFLPGAPTVTVTVNYLSIDNFDGLPPGLTYATNPGSGSITGGNSGCIGISGTPTTAGQYVGDLATTLNITVPQSVPFIGGTTQNAPGPLAYNFDVSGATAVNPASGQGFTVAMANPNPASDQAKITVHTTTQSDISLEVYSITGQRMYAQTESFASGDHSLVLNVRSLKAGMYFYTVSNGTEKVTRRLVVAR